MQPNVNVRKIITTPGTQGFLMWLRERQPYLYRRIKGKIATEPTLGDVVGADRLVATAQPAAPTSSTADFLKNLVLGAGQVLLTKEQLKAQQKILDLQLERARQNLPPADIDPTQYGLPAPSVQIGVDSETRRSAFIFGGIALGVGALLWMFSGRRRRAS